MKEKLIKFVIAIYIYRIIIRLCTWGVKAIFFIDYYEWMDIALFFIGLAIVSLGIYQLITMKVNYKYFGGRILGILILASVITLIPIVKVNNLNKILSNAYKNKEVLLKQKHIMAKAKSYKDIEKEVNNMLLENSNNTLDDFKVIRNNGLNIYYEAGDYSESIEVIKEVIFSDEIKEISKYIRILKDSEVNIVIVNEIKKINSFITNDTAGYYDSLTGNIVLQTVSKSNSLKEYKGIIFHEYVHYALDKEVKAILGEATILPKWFDEGLATYLETKSYNSNIQEFNIVPVVSDIRDDSNFYNANAFNHYEYSKYLVKYILEKGGNNFIINLFEDMKITNDIYQSIENILGESFEEIELNIFGIAKIEDLN